MDKDYNKNKTSSDFVIQNRQNNENGKKLQEKVSSSQLENTNKPQNLPTNPLNREVPTLSRDDNRLTKKDDGLKKRESRLPKKSPQNNTELKKNPHNNTNPKEIYNQNRHNLQDVKNIQERMAASQARNINKPLNNFENGDNSISQKEEEITNNDNPSESEEKNKQDIFKKTKQKTGFRRVVSSLIGGQASGQIAGASEIILGPLKRLILMGAISFIALATIILFAGSVLISHSEKNREYNKSTVKKYSSITNDNDSYRISEKKLNKEVPTFDPEEDNPDDFFEENLKEDLINYLSNNGYCGKGSCEKSDAFAFYKRLIIHVLKNEKDGKSIDVGLLYETMAYYRADDELFQGSTQTENLKWWQVILSLFKKKTDEMDKLTDKMFKRKNIDLNQYAAYLLYGDESSGGSNGGNNFKGYIDIGDASSMAEAMIATAYSKLGLGETCGINCNEITQHYGMVGSPWCALFVSWVIANTEYDGKKLSDILKISTAASWDFSNYFHHENPNLKWYYNDYCSRYAGKNGSGHYQPKMGDVFILNWDGKWPSGWSTHIGIVVSSDGHMMKTIEGNDGNNEVGEHVRDLTSCSISGYGSWY